MNWDRLWRPIVLTGAVCFAIYAVIYVIARQMDVGDDALSVVGGVMAYGFIIAAVLIGVREWRRSRREDGDDTGPNQAP